MPSTRFFLKAGLAVLLMVTSSSCMQSPREKLLGRWYSSDISLRFHENGSTVFNSPQGLARGNYHFDETAKPLGTTAPHPNLLLDVVRNRRRIQLRFEVEILSRDRIRLTEVPTLTATASSGRTTIPRFKVLKRAEEETPVGTPGQTAVSSTR